MDPAENGGIELHREYLHPLAAPPHAGQYDLGRFASRRPGANPAQGAAGGGAAQTQKRSDA